MVQDATGADEGRLAASWQNKSLGRALRAARLAFGDGGSKQAAFAARLSRDLGIPVSTTAVSNWENGKRTVPGPVLLAAATAAGESLDALLSESGVPEVVAWAEGLELPQQVARLTSDMGALRTELVEVRQQYGDFFAEVVDSLARAGLPYPKRPVPRLPDRRGRKERGGSEAAGT
jgi:transcriptional regulator with XRE-family HTH domain